MPATLTSIKAYYEHVLSGRATSQADRIMSYLLRVDRPVTRHEVVDRYFCVHPGPRSLDGKKTIPWQSATARITGLLQDGYLQVSREGECPVTGTTSEFLTPVGDRWANRRLF